MRVFITGAAGFIGSNLARACLAAGHQVHGLDDLSAGTLLNLEGCLGSPGFTYTLGSVLDAEIVQQAGRGADVLFHFAAFKIPRFESAAETIDVNLRGTAHAMAAAKANGSHLVFASTSDVYGKNPKCPFAETDDLVIGPPTVRRWSYALSKAMGEQMIFAQGPGAFPFTIVRFFGGYGPGQHLSWWGGPHAVFINNVLDGERLAIHGDGCQTRSFTYIEDHVEGLMRIAVVPEARSEVINLGSDEEVTIRDLALSVWRLMRPDDEPQVTYVPYETFGKYEDVMRRVPDNRKAARLLGVTPRWTLERGLPLTIAWQIARRKQLSAGS